MHNLLMNILDLHLHARFCAKREFVCLLYESFEGIN